MLEVVDSNLESRGYIRAYFGSYVRSKFDNEKFIDSATLSATFPHVYITLKSPNYPVQGYNCNQFIPGETPETKLKFLKKANEYFKRRGIRYVLAFSPVNQDECKDGYQYFPAYKKLIEEFTGIEVIDLGSTIQDPKYYYEAVHLNAEGAKILSAQMGEALKKQFFEPR